MDTLRIYRNGQERLAALAATLDESARTTLVPACPAWDVRQTYAHMAGLCVEVVQGLVTPPTRDEETARQVADRAGMSLDEIAAEWTENTPALLELVGSQSRRRYALPALDVWHHENDIRGALGMGPRTEDADQLADFVLGGLALAWSSDLPSVRVRATDTDRTWSLGEGADLTLEATAYELARAVTGRRSLAQIGAMDWSGDPSAVVGRLPSLPAPEIDLEV
ncbi:maleylpyruvate isomerase family mycothiol-dependent enzyme [Nocardiopsis alba]|uniref:maleylpyruvate isomerase family mycothiol-dependent enzyme n=1 Tax=Nocardiopsis alba TaxID=53437 RepID=UPI00366AF481